MAESAEVREILSLLGYDNPDDDPPEEARAPIERLVGFFRSAADRLRSFGQEMGRERTDVRERLGLPSAVPTNQRMLAQSDQRFVRPAPPLAPEPVPVLEAEGPRTISDQARRAENIQQSADRGLPTISPSSAFQAWMSNPAVQQFATAADIGLDFTGAGIVKDIGLGALNYLRGDEAAALGYGLATIPFLGNTTREALRAMRPYNRAAVKNTVGRSAMDPMDPTNNLVFVEPRNFLESVYPGPASYQGLPGPDERKLARLLDIEDEGQIAQLPFMGIRQSLPYERVRALRDLGIIRDEDADEITRRLSRAYADLAGTTRNPTEQQWRATFNADLPDQIMEVLTRENFPLIVDLHEGRHRMYQQLGLGSAATPAMVRYYPDVPSNLLDIPLMFRESRGKVPMKLVDAPTDVSRLRTQSRIASTVGQRYGSDDPRYVTGLKEALIGPGAADAYINYPVSETARAQSRAIARELARQSEPPVALKWGTRFLEELDDILGTRSFGGVMPAQPIFGITEMTNPDRAARNYLLRETEMAYTPYARRRR